MKLASELTVLFSKFSVVSSMDQITREKTFEKHKQDWDLLAHTKAPITE